MTVKPASKIIQFPKIPEIPINVEHLKAVVNKSSNPEQTTIPLDLTSKRKAILIVGAGNVGKTLLARWIGEQALARDADLQIATADGLNRELVHYFDGCLQTGPGVSPKDWLSMVLTSAMSDTGSLLIDLGGGDTSLAELARELPDLAQIMQNAGLVPVLVVMLSPRILDLTPLAALQAFHFVPQSTMLICNLGRGQVPDFESIRSHSVYRETLMGGAVEIFMPRLYRAEVVEQRRLSFTEAASDEGPLAIFDRQRVRAWLEQMSTAFARVKSWLP